MLEFSLFLQIRVRQGPKVAVRRELRAGDISEGDEAVKLAHRVPGCTVGGAGRWPQDGSSPEGAL